MRVVLSEDQNAAVIFTDARTLYLKTVPYDKRTDACCNCAALSSDVCLMHACAGKSLCGESRQDRRQIIWEEADPCSSYRKTRTRPCC